MVVKFRESSSAPIPLRRRSHRKAIHQCDDRWCTYSKMVCVGMNELSSLRTESPALPLLTVGDHGNVTIRSTSGVIDKLWFTTTFCIPLAINNIRYQRLVHMVCHHSNRIRYKGTPTPRQIRPTDICLITNHSIINDLNDSNYEKEPRLARRVLSRATSWSPKTCEIHIRNVIIHSEPPSLVCWLWVGFIWCIVIDPAIHITFMLFESGVVS